MRYSTGNATKLATGTGNVLVPTDPGTGPVPVRYHGTVSTSGCYEAPSVRGEADDQCATIHSLSRLNEALIVCLIETTKEHEAQTNTTRNVQKPT